MGSALPSCVTKLLGHHQVLLHVVDSLQQSHSEITVNTELILCCGACRDPMD